MSGVFWYIVVLVWRSGFSLTLHLGHYIDPLHAYHTRRPMPRSPCWWAVRFTCINAASPKMHTLLHNAQHRVIYENAQWNCPPVWRIQDFSADDVRWNGSILLSGPYLTAWVTPGIFSWVSFPNLKLQRPCLSFSLGFVASAVIKFIFFLRVGCFITRLNVIEWNEKLFKSQYLSNDHVMMKSLFMKVSIDGHVLWKTVEWKQKPALWGDQ